jgi:hypothetical protein
MNEVVAEWTRFLKGYKAACESKWLRTIIMDTATAVWGLLRLVRFGKLAQVPPHKYGAVNTEYENLINMAYESDKNLILIHSMKKEYTNERWTGGYERDGYSRTGYIVQAEATMEFVENINGKPIFACTLHNCHQNMGVAGLRLEGSMASFPWIGMSVFPDSNPDEWMDGIEF